MMMTFEENTEASQPFFLSYVIRCVRVEKLEDPAQCTYHIVYIIMVKTKQPVHDDVVSDVEGGVQELSEHLPEVIS